MNNDLISRSALLKEMRTSGRAAYMIVQEAPAVEAVPVRHGRWVSRYAKHWKGKDECGECGFHEKDHRDLSHMKYCPNCGAKMNKEAE
jgi:membrane protease subunit (stomatin/prohibitin family)